MPTDEAFSGKKFIKGFVDPAMLRKVLPIMFWAVLVLLFCFGTALIAVKVKEAFFPKREAPVKIDTNSGHVETNSDRRAKIGVINF